MGILQQIKNLGKLEKSNLGKLILEKDLLEETNKELFKLEKVFLGKSNRKFNATTIN